MKKDKLIKSGKYRKSKIPKNKRPSVKDLAKRHNIGYKMVVLNYREGELIDKILKNLKKKMGGTNTSILRNALFSYNIFIKNSVERCENE